jgi:hypothetical protein
MTRTVTALYETKAQAERARDTLVAAHLGDHVDIRDETEAKHDPRDIVEWLADLFGGHKDSHVYGEGLRRGHVLLTATVEDFNEIRAAELLDADAPVDLDKAEQSWRAEGWTPTADPAATPAGDAVPEADPVGGRVRVYTIYT